MKLETTPNKQLKKPTLLDRIQAHKLNKQAHSKDKVKYNDSKDFKETLIIDEILEADDNG